MVAAPEVASVSRNGKAPAFPPIDHEELVIRRGRRTGVSMAIAVHSTALGPALGGCRLWHYPGPTEAARDALRLSEAMTLKAAAAGLRLGGGKGVICLPAASPAPHDTRRRDVLHDFADLVDSLNGEYITAEDVGTCAHDMVTVAERTRFVTGLPVLRGGSGDPSPFTALGVEAAMRACCAQRFGRPELAGRTVAVVGCGRVGEKLSRRLAAAGARLLLADIEPGKRGLAARMTNASWVSPGEALGAEVDVLAPCALGGVVDERTVDELRCRIVCGAANNQLAHDGLADRLAARGVLYAPDFIANAGGLMNVSLELEPEGYDAGRARRRAAGIEKTMAAVLARARERGTTPLAAAVELARQRLEAAALATAEPRRLPQAS
jgi:leucine dehydrogenase